MNKDMMSKMNITNIANIINITKSKMVMKRKLVMAMLLLLLTSCATYNSGFSCGDAKGVACTPMEKVDWLISSGEIERYVSKKQNCRGRRCRNAVSLGDNDLQAALSGKGRK